ncbi:MAG: hypothetical protein QXX23_06365 [Thermoplasmata archaeon]
METYEEQYVPITKNLESFMTKEKVKELTDLATYVILNTVKLYNKGIIPFALYPPVRVDRIYWKTPLRYSNDSYEFELNVIVYNAENKKRTKIVFSYRLYTSGNEILTIAIPGAVVMSYDYKEFIKAIREIKYTRINKFDVNTFVITDEQDLIALNFVLQNNYILYKKELASLDLVEKEVKAAGLEEKLKEDGVHLLVVKDKDNMTLYVLKRK